MSGKIQTKNSSLDNQLQIQAAKSSVAPKSNFCANSKVSDADKFESQSPHKQKNGFIPILLTAAGLGIAAIALRAKLGGIIKSVGEKPPFTIWGRLSKVFDIVSKDSMTGLFNKGSLLSNLSSGYKKAVKHKQNLGVAMLDMDNFKAINEVFGHNAGDIVLKRIAANIQSVTKKHGAKGFRYGGEEFVVTLENQNHEALQKLTAEIADSIKEDAVIQSYLPKFKEKANASFEFVMPRQEQLKSIFKKLRGAEKINNIQDFANEITYLIDEHLHKYKPANARALEELTAMIKSAKPEELPQILKLGTKIDDGRTLGEELDSISSQYKSISNDLQKWIAHINKHGKFTVSGGTVNLDEASMVKDGESLVKIADAALKSAKVNGKNIIVPANSRIISKTAAEITTEQARTKAHP